MNRKFQIANSKYLKFWSLVLRIYLLFGAWNLVFNDNLVDAGAFDNVGLNARPLGMGETFTAVSGDLDSINYNPAGLSELSIARLLVSYRDFYNLGLVTQKYAGFSVPERYFNFGFSWHRIGTTSDVEFVDYKEDTYIITIAGRLGRLKNLSAGMNFKFFRVFSRSNASGYGLDAGLQYYLLDKRLRFGVFSKNTGNAELHWDTGAKDLLKPDYRFGVSFMPAKSLLLAVDYSTQEMLNFGSEITVFSDRLVLRGGLNRLNEKHMRLCSGVSFAFGGLQLDYALASHHAMGVTHFFTLNIAIKGGSL